MNETQMIDAIKHKADVMGLADGVYIFKQSGKCGTIKNYQQDESHYQIMYDGLTPEQVVDVFVGEETCKDLGGIGADGEQVFHCSECGCVLALYDKEGNNNLCTSFIFDYPRFCPECGARIEMEP